MNAAGDPASGDRTESQPVLAPIVNPGCKPPQRTLALNGEDLVYETADIPSAPAVHFSDRIDDLFEEWEISVLLKVKERGVPIKYWSKLYKFATKSPAFTSWLARKSEWAQWQVRQLRIVYSDVLKLTIVSLVSGQGAEAFQQQ